MKNSFENKVVLITGGSRGIGLAAAKEFAGLGAKVIISHSNKSVKAVIKIPLLHTLETIRQIDDNNVVYDTLCNK